MEGTPGRAQSQRAHPPSQSKSTVAGGRSHTSTPPPSKLIERHAPEPPLRPWTSTDWGDASSGISCKIAIEGQVRIMRVPLLSGVAMARTTRPWIVAPASTSEPGMVVPGGGHVATGTSAPGTRTLMEGEPLEARVKTMRELSISHLEKTGTSPGLKASSRVRASDFRSSWSSYTSSCRLSGSVTGVATAARYLPEGEKRSDSKCKPSRSFCVVLRRLSGLMILETFESLISLSFIDVDDHSTPSKPWETLIVDLDARAKAGAKSDECQSAAVIADLCFPEPPEVESSMETESHTAKEPSTIPTASCPARFHTATRGSKFFCEERALERRFLYAIPDHI
mmetsp:Transcript_9331/g.19073  ORF Transcript_9331/g.19073 Transcript_9331/m.19073 type:complete len:339 (-) Transcript_9331:1131-2147(-)